MKLGDSFKYISAFKFSHKILCILFFYNKTRLKKPISLLGLTFVTAVAFRFYVAVSKVIEIRISRKFYTKDANMPINGNDNSIFL